MESRRSMICSVPRIGPKPRQDQHTLSMLQSPFIPLQFAGGISEFSSTFPCENLIAPYFEMLIYASPLSDEDIHQPAVCELN